jgi:hypothetical protein
MFYTHIAVFARLHIRDNGTSDLFRRTLPLENVSALETAVIADVKHYTF